MSFVHVHTVALPSSVDEVTFIRVAIYISSQSSTRSFPLCEESFIGTAVFPSVCPETMVAVVFPVSLIRVAVDILLETAPQINPVTTKFCNDKGDYEDRAAAYD